MYTYTFPMPQLKCLYPRGLGFPYLRHQLCSTVNWSIQTQRFRLYPRASMTEPLRMWLTEVSVVPKRHAEPALPFTAPRKADHTPHGTLKQGSWPHPSQESWLLYSREMAPPRTAGEGDLTPMACA